MSKGDSVKGLVWVALFGASLVAVGSTRGWGEALRAVKWLVVFSSPALLLLLVMGLLLGVVWLLQRPRALKFVAWTVGLGLAGGGLWFVCGLVPTNPIVMSPGAFLVLVWALSRRPDDDRKPPR